MPQSARRRRPLPARPEAGATAPLSPNSHAPHITVNTALNRNRVATYPAGPRLKIVNPNRGNSGDKRGQKPFTPLWLQRGKARVPPGERGEPGNQQQASQQHKGESPRIRYFAQRDG